MIMHIIKNKKYMLIGTALLILVWWIVSDILSNAIILPSPRETLDSLEIIVSDKSFAYTLMATLQRCILGFVISLIFASIVGIIAALNKKILEMLQPTMALLETVPTMAIIVLALIWLTNEKAPILLASIVVFPVIYEAVIQGIVGIDKSVISMTKVYKVGITDSIRYIYIPSMAKSVFGVLSSVIGLCLKMVIGGEVLGQPNYGVGTSIQMEKMQLNTAGVFSWIVILVIFVLFIESIIKLMTKRWRTFN
ncbi:ABC transporter permease [Clostridium sp. 'White wine YQ']|uniref:ABC transporter permease n=1 Tax=Clostridium sp. 'White wine YQ' TaxID=3027474 RepID=UPI002365DDDA|nr:ABC transporter permease subunit [Clostridium sp. 'White wine YQ']MDD7795835.1 ABC transporter permease subunit [Clostridium sp. 'White wine YQ']